jgi:hypothetical protein
VNISGWKTLGSRLSDSQMRALVPIGPSTSITGDVADWIGAVAALISAAGVVVGGGWAYFKFLRSAPFVARANLSVQADLLVQDGNDLIRARCIASAIGQGQVTFVLEGEDVVPPTISVYRMTPELLQRPPDEWVDACAAVLVFPDDDVVAGGEALEEVVLIWIGPRAPDTVAYRVAVNFEAKGEGEKESAGWQAVAIVPVEARPQAATQ